MQKVKAIFSTLLIPVLLWAGMGFSLNRHYCLGMLVDEAWYFVSAECESQLHESKDNCKESISSSFPCCSDQWVSIAGLSIISQPQEKTNCQTVVAIADATALNSSLSSPLLKQGKLGSQYKSKAPPLLSKEIVIEYQRFLI